jgi:hypothetical protein
MPPAPPRARPIASISSMKTMDGATLRADDHLDELGGAGREERHVGLTGDGPGQQGLAGAGRAGEEHALGQLGAELAVLGGVLEVVDDLDELVLHLVDAGDVVERDAHLAGLDRLCGLRLADAAEPAAHHARAAPHDPDPQAGQEEHGQEGQQQVEEHAAAGVDRLRLDLHAGRLELLGELVRVGEGGDLGAELGVGLVAAVGVPGGLLEGALDGQAGGVDLLDVLGVHLLGELGVGDGLDLAAVEEGRDEEERGVHHEQCGREPPPVDFRPAAWGAGQSLGAPGRLGLALVVTGPRRP